MSPPATADALASTLEELTRAGEALRSRPRASIAGALGTAWARVADPEDRLGRAAREALRQTSGLTPPMVAWALDATLRLARPQLEACARLMAPPAGVLEAPPRLGALVLAGNVFSACVQPISVALMARVPILVKASSQDDALPRVFAAALGAIDPDLARACRVVTMARGAPALEEALLSRADVLSVFGADSTITSLRARASARTTFVGHGHGLGLGYVQRGVGVAEAARAFAQDVCAYDQRGCMSPHAIAVEGDGAAFAAALAAALEERAQALPRGPLPTAVGAEQVQWRGLGAVRGHLYEGRGWAVSFEARQGPRTSPGWRNVVVFEAGRAELGAHAGALGVHLKALGVAGDRAAVARSLPAGVAPRVCAAGQMQTPSLLAYADGLPPWTGWQRFRAVD